MQTVPAFAKANKLTEKQVEKKMKNGELSYAEGITSTGEKKTMILNDSDILEALLEAGGLQHDAMNAKATSSCEASSFQSTKTVGRVLTLLVIITSASLVAQVLTYIN